MSDIYFFRIFNLLAGVIGVAIGIGLLLVPNVVAQIEKKLDKNFSTEHIEKLLNERRNLSEALLRRPKVFGGIVLFLAFLLVLSSLLWI